MQAEQAGVIVSYLLSKVALRRELVALFAELSRPRGTRILLHSAQGYLATDGPVRFEGVDRAVAARSEIALGVRHIGRPGASPWILASMQCEPFAEVWQNC